MQLFSQKKHIIFYLRHQKMLFPIVPMIHRYYLEKKSKVLLGMSLTYVHLVVQQEVGYL